MTCSTAMSDGTLDLRLELRTRNNILWHVVFDAFDSVASFGRAHDIGIAHIHAYLNLRRGPYRKDGQLRPSAQRLADIAKLLVDDLFPEALYAVQIPQRLIAEVSPDAFISLIAAGPIALPAGQDDLVFAAELRSGLDVALQTLKPREQQIIRARFGLNGEDEQSLRDVGVLCGVSTERIRQIEAKALRRLRHPSRRLHKFIEHVG